MGRFVLPIVAAAALSLAGCKGACRQMSEELCNCQTTSVLKNNCLTNVATKAGLYTVTAADDANCAKLLDGCKALVADGRSCSTQLSDLAGQQACGLAR